MERLSIKYLAAYFKKRKEIYLYDSLKEFAKKRGKILQVKSDGSSQQYIFTVGEVLFIRDIFYYGKVNLTEKYVCTEFDRIQKTLNIDRGSCDYELERTIRSDFFNEFLSVASQSLNLFETIRIENALFKNAEPPDHQPNWSLNLQGRSLQYSLEFVTVSFSGGVNVKQASINGMSFTDCNFISPTDHKDRKYFVYGDYLFSERTIRFNSNSFASPGLLSFKGSVLNRNFQVHNTSEKRDLPYINFYSAEIKGSVDIQNSDFNLMYAYCLRNHQIKPQKTFCLAICFAFATIEGSLKLEDVSISSLNDLSEDHIVVGLFLREARIGRSFIGNKLKFQCKHAIDAYSLKVNSVLFDKLGESTSTFEGIVNFSSVETMLDFEISKAEIGTMDHATELNLMSAKIHGDFIFTSSILYGPLIMDGCTIQRETILSRSQITSATGYAVSAVNATFGGSVTLRSGFLDQLNGGPEASQSETTLTGGLSLGSAVLQRSLDLAGATYTPHEDQENKRSIDLYATQVMQDLYFNHGENQDETLTNQGVIDLRNASINKLHIDPSITHETNSYFRISNMEFRTLIGHVIKRDHGPTNVSRCIEDCRWFRIHEGDDPHQPYEALIKHFKGLGDHKKARKVIYLNNTKSGNPTIRHKGMEQIIRQLFYGVVYGFNAAGIPAYKSFVVVLFLPVLYTLIFSTSLASNFSDHLLNTYLFSLPFVDSNEGFPSTNWDSLLLKTLMIIFLSLMVIDLANWNRKK